MTSNTFGNAPPIPSTRSQAWLWPFAPMAVAAFSLSALVFYHLRHDGYEARSALQHAYSALYRTFGFAPAVMFFGLVVLWSTIWLVHGRLDRPLQRLGRLAAMALLLGVLLNLGEGGVAPALHKGALGAWLAGAMVAAVGYWPSLVVIWGFTFASLLLATDFFFHESFERMLAVDAGERAPSAAAAGGAPPAAPALAPAGVASADPAAPAGTAAGAPAADDGQAWRRRSYYERRAERVAAAARWGQPEASVDLAPAAASLPPSVDATSGDELSAARVVAAIDAAEGEDGAAIASEEAEALDRGSEAVAGEAAPAAPAGAPIVFPDEVAAPVSEVRDGATADRDAAVEWSAAAALGAAAADEAPAAAGGPIDPVAMFEPVEPVEPRDTAGASEATPAAAAPEGFDAPLARDPFVWHVADGGDRDGAEARAGAATEPAAAGDDREALAAWLRRAGAWREAPPDAGDATTPTDEPVDDGAPIEPVAEVATEPAAEVAAEPAASAAELAAAPAAADPIVTIPRPEAAAARPGAPDEALMREAIELVLSTRRANAVFLQRKLRIDYDLAAAVLIELAARGIVALDAEATHGRILV